VRQVSVNEWLGYSVALAGFAAYNAAKSGYFDGTPGASGGSGGGGGGGGSGGAGLGLGQGGGVGTITPASSYNALKVRSPSLLFVCCCCTVASHLPRNHSQRRVVSSLLSCVLRVQINKSSMDSTDDAERGRALLMPPPKGSLPSPKAARRDTSSGGVAGAIGGGGGGTEYSSGKLTQAATRR
jgi:hypothetical protein